MKRSIALVLIYFLLQMLATGVVVLFTGQSSLADVQRPMVYGLLLSDILMAGLLFFMGYLSEKKLWKPAEPSFMLWTFLAGISGIFITDTVSSIADFLPDLLEDSFASIESSWMGVLAVAIVGPVLEEMLFRGAITTELLKRYSPKKAIILSALIFGIFHLNPAQILVASIMGLLLAWLFYKTRSLWPSILVHIMNNSLAVFFTNNYPEAERFTDIMGNLPYYLLLIAAICLFCFSVFRLTKPTDADAITH